MAKFKPGDVVYEVSIPSSIGIVLGYSGSGHHVDILMRDYHKQYFSVWGIPEKDVMATGEHIDISTLVEWYK